LKNKPLSEKLGSALASIQDLLDMVVKVLVKRMQDKPGVGFFSKVGDSYFKSYEEAKRKNKSG